MRSTYLRDLIDPVKKEVVNALCFSSKEHLIRHYAKNSESFRKDVYQKLNSLFDDLSAETGIKKRKLLFFIFNSVNTVTFCRENKDRSVDENSIFIISDIVSWAILKTMRENNIFNSFSNSLFRKVIGDFHYSYVASEQWEKILKDKSYLINEYHALDDINRIEIINSSPESGLASLLSIEKKLSLSKCKNLDLISSYIPNLDFSLVNALSDSQLWSKLSLKNVIPFLEKELGDVDFSKITKIKGREKNKLLGDLSCLIFYAAKKNIKALDFFIDRGFDFTYKKYFKDEDFSEGFPVITSIYNFILGSKAEPESTNIVKALHEKEIISIFKTYPLVFCLGIPIVDRKDKAQELQIVVDEISLNHECDNEFNL